MSNATELQAAALENKAWPFEEARKLLARYPNGFPEGGVLFETGYGPSGLPHIGTFQEVLRTSLVRRAYEVLTGGAPTGPFVCILFCHFKRRIRRVIMRAHLRHGESLMVFDSTLSNVKPKFIPMAPLVVGARNQLHYWHCGLAGLRRECA